MEKDRGDQKAGDDKKDIYADKATRKPRDAGMEQNDGEDGERS